MQPPLLMDRGGAETEKSDRQVGRPFVNQAVRFPQAPEVLAEWRAELRRRLLGIALLSCSQRIRSDSVDVYPSMSGGKDEVAIFT
jgi:hypothetical protein